MAYLNSWGYDARSEYYDLEHDNTSDFEFYSRCNLNSSEPILVVPCGSGRLLDLFDESFDVYFSDIEEKMVIKIREKLFSRGIIEERAFISDLFSLPKMRMYKLVIISAEAIQLFDNDGLRKIIASISNILMVDGRILIDTAKFTRGERKNGMPLYYDSASYYSPPKLNLEKKTCKGDTFQRFVEQLDLGYMLIFNFHYYLSGVKINSAKINIWRISFNEMNVACQENGLFISGFQNSYVNDKLSDSWDRAIYEIRWKT